MKAGEQGKMKTKNVDIISLQKATTQKQKPQIQTARWQQHLNSLLWLLFATALLCLSEQEGVSTRNLALSHFQKTTTPTKAESEQATQFILKVLHCDFHIPQVLWEASYPSSLGRGRAFTPQSWRQTCNEILHRQPAVRRAAFLIPNEILTLWRALKIHCSLRKLKRILRAELIDVCSKTVRIFNVWGMNRKV